MYVYFRRRGTLPRGWGRQGAPVPRFEIDARDAALSLLFPAELPAVPQVSEGNEDEWRRCMSLSSG